MCAATCVCECVHTNIDKNKHIIEDKYSNNYVVIVLFDYNVTHKGDN